MLDEEHPQAGQPLLGEELSQPEEPWHFQIAVDRVENYLKSLSFPDESPEGRMDKYMKITQPTSQLSTLALDFELMGRIPDLADSSSRHKAGRELAAQLQNPELDEAIRAIYSELFGQDLAVYADSPQQPEL